ncbi:helix-turn-helix transcriptional regulator [Alphaproteobacteria bacterium GH1-50]|uniref:Helix-turn-helix transcriptional regulator n=1 Tax=Kangsaoukella pontilimi TaxID=2691042 RepID=A0A7C9IIZ7_9RHOB|nr:LuxR C-terminal-related transcriptional regulator [Kangsaoukella pontilimi]MXQ08622.1 helix-turn-helix transcriptional regulator [Kangsaoukella pontilimi]
MRRGADGIRATGRSRRKYVLGAVLVLQALCAVFFVGQILISVLGLPIAPIDWQLYELIEIGAAIGLTVGVAVGVIALRQAQARSARAEKSLRQARSAFQTVLEEHFDQWGLTPAERDVALFAIKGFSTNDIADLRGVSDGTIKAQTAAIYRKAGVSGRAQLLSVFIDDLVADEGPVPDKPASKTAGDHSSAA